MTGDLRERAERFRRLHDDGLFVMPCAWDAGSAKLFASMGFAAIGTTSGGVNWSHGRPDYVYSVPRDDMLNSYAAIAAATALPTSGDLENGYGSTADDVADTIRRAIASGLVGGSIEDQSSDAQPGLVAIDDAAERIAAARAAADASGVAFTITARAESYFGGVDTPFDDAVERANRYVAAGADCVFVPGPADLDTISALVRHIDGPISVGIGSGGGDLTIDALREIGVRRVSTGGAIPRALHRVVSQLSEEILEAGTFGFASRAEPEESVNALMSDD